jgi:hypothetical protein
MTIAAVVLIIVSMSVAWHLFVHQLSGRRSWNPLWLAFSTTTFAALYLVAGAIGYRLDRHDRFVARSGWAGHVLWPEIGIGLLAALAAVYFWRKGLQSVSSG